MNLPKVSIITSSLNQGKFIEENIKCIKDQNYPYIEHIIIDGGSNDETLKILKKYTKEVKWISEPDKGQSDALNKGFRMAKGEIIGWLNADDLYKHYAIKTAIDFFISHPDVEMVYGQCNFINERGEKIGEWMDKLDFDYHLLTNKALNFIPQPAVFFRKKVLDKVGYLDVNLKMAMDYDFWIRIGKEFRVVYIPKVLANFRVHQNAKSSKWFDFWPEILTVLIKHVGSKPLHWYFKRYYKMAKANGLNILEACKLFERLVNDSKYLNKYRALLQRKSLSRAYMELAKEQCSSHKDRSKTQLLLQAIKIDSSIILRREFTTLLFKSVLGF